MCQLSKACSKGTYTEKERAFTIAYLEFEGATAMMTARARATSKLTTKTKRHGDIEGAYIAHGRIGFHIYTTYSVFFL